MTQERAARTRRRAPRQDDETLDPEQAEALSRAAREAVRQPADPRLEKSFAHLGLVPDPEPNAAPKRTRTRRPPAVAAIADVAPVAAVDPPEPVAPPASVSPSVDLQPLVDAIATLSRTTDEIRRRLDVLTRLLVGLLVAVALVVVLLLVRGAA